MSTRLNVLKHHSWCTIALAMNVVLLLCLLFLSTFKNLHKMNVDATVNEETAKLLPTKSKQSYEKEYELFLKWKKLNNIESTTNEKTLIAYFGDKSKRSKSSCLWSMLKKTLLVHEKIDISRYNLLISILKNKTKGYKPKKSLVFDRKDVLNFWQEASDDDYLLEKVISIMGIFGACRSCELHGLTLEDVNDRGHVVMVNLRDTKTCVDRSFGIVGNENSINPLDIIRKYMSLRSAHVTHNFFFINYRNHKCTVQRVGINKLYKAPEKIANYLKLDSPEKYTGHCFRRSSATILANSGGDLLNVKNIGGWKSSSVAESYVEQSEVTKIKVSEKILVGVQGNNTNNIGTSCSKRMTMGSLNIEHIENCTIVMSSDKLPA